MKLSTRNYLANSFDNNDNDDDSNATYNWVL